MAGDPDYVENFGLTERQAQIYQMVEEDRLNYTEIGRRLGIDRRTVTDAYRMARKKLDKQLSLVHSGSSASQPSKFDSSKGPQIETVIEGLVRECRELEIGKKVTDGSILEGIDETIAKALYFLRRNEMALVKATPKDLATIVNGLVEKRQLLKGEPTAITKLQDIRKLDEVAAALDKEMKRRGMLVDVTPEEPSAQEG